MGIFRFKQFSVCDDRATMKVGTDAVLLGAMANITNKNTILDIGTGSGIIALMLAQRTDANVMIDAIELATEDSRQASENVRNSPWPTKISIINESLQTYRPHRTYDLIVCNPPYFTNSLLPPSKERSDARHTITLTFDELLAGSRDLIKESGILCVILPPAEAEAFVAKARVTGFSLVHRTFFITRRDKPAERVILSFSRSVADVTVSDSLTLYEDNNCWSEEYWDLTKQFYLQRK